MDDLPRSQRPRRSYAGPSSYVVRSQGRRWRGAWESSVDWKRPHSPSYFGGGQAHQWQGRWESSARRKRPRSPSYVGGGQSRQWRGAWESSVRWKRPRSPSYGVGGQGRQWQGGWESSVSRKRPFSPANPPPLPLRTPPRYYSEDDDDDGSQGQDDGDREEEEQQMRRRIFDDDDGGRGRDDDDREEDEQQIRRQIFDDDDGSRGQNDDDSEEDEQQTMTSQDERGTSRDDVFSDGPDADDVGEAGGVEEQPPAEEEYSDDDDRPIGVVSPAPAPVPPESSPTTPALAPLESSTTAPAPAPAPAPPEQSPPSSSSSDSSSVIRNVTVDNSSAFDCSICYLPLKSPIFQCTGGHVVCSPCHDRLGQATDCHVCRVSLPDGYFRCNAMEQVVDSIRVPCPHAVHGCTEGLAYHDRDCHAQTCVHKPCHCPSDGCGFASPVQTTLLEHFATEHGWPCITGRTGTRSLYMVHLRKGFNVVVVTTSADQGTMELQYTMVLNVEQTALVSTITAFCIHPSNTGAVRLGLSYCRQWRQESDLRSMYLQLLLDVVCTDLSNGMPSPGSCFPPFLVPRWSAQGEDDDDIRVTVSNICST